MSSQLSFTEKFIIWQLLSVPGCYENVVAIIDENDFILYIHKLLKYNFVEIIIPVYYLCKVDMLFAHLIQIFTGSIYIF